MYCCQVLQEIEFGLTKEIVSSIVIDYLHAQERSSFRQWPTRMGLVEWVSEEVAKSCFQESAAPLHQKIQFSQPHYHLWLLPEHQELVQEAETHQLVGDAQAVAILYLPKNGVRNASNFARRGIGYTYTVILP